MFIWWLLRLKYRLSRSAFPEHESVCWLLIGVASIPEYRQQILLFVTLYARVYICCWWKASVFFCFHIGKLQMMLSKLRFHIHDNILSFLIAGLIMWGKKSNGFRATGSLLIGSTGSAAWIMFWNSAGTRACAPRHTIMFFGKSTRRVDATSAVVG